VNNIDLTMSIPVSNRQTPVRLLWLSATTSSEIQMRTHTDIEFTVTCHDLPTLTVTNVSFPRRCTAKGTASVMYPSARKGKNSGADIPNPCLLICMLHGLRNPVSFCC
jgi:hypothetical protein